MNKLNRTLLAACTLTLLASVPARAERSLWAVSYDFAVPTYSFRTDYIGDVSYRGLNIETRYLLRKDLSIGLDFRVNGFNQQYPLKTITTGDQPLGSAVGAISGPVYRYVNTWEALGSVHYYFSQDTIRPYIGLSAGGIWTYHKALTADLQLSDTGFHFAAVPELGAMFQLQGGPYAYGILVNARYNLTTAAFSTVNNMQFASFAVGVYWLE